MTDRELAEALAAAQDIERKSRAHWKGSALDDLAERDGALVVVRKSTELVRMLEQWMTARASRAALSQR